MDFPDIIKVALSQMLSMVVDPASDAELDVISHDVDRAYLTN